MEPDLSLRVGLSSVCITPPEPVWLYGYSCAVRFTPYTGKEHELYAKTMAFEDAAGTRTVLMTLDLCVMRQNVAARLMARIIEQTGLAPEHIIVNLSHTHSGPMIGTEDPQRWPLPQDMRERIRDYTEFLIELLAEAAAKALADLRPARIRWGRGRVEFVRNRRMFDEQGKYSGMKPNPDGFTDPRVTVLRVDEPDGTLRALLCSLACHAVTLGPKNLQLCGDYPGFAKAALEAHHPGVTALFVQGCGADANSEPRGTPDQMECARRQGEQLAEEVARVAAGELQPVRGPIRAAQAGLELPLRQRTRAELETEATGPASTAHNPRRILELLDRGETPATTYATTISLWRFGNDLTLAALPGETVAGYIPRLEAIFDPARLWVAGYCNDVFGYLPTAQIIREGGYEDRGLVCDIGQFDADVENVMVEGLRRLGGTIDTKNRQTEKS
ncbi:MAG: neutral/alkaline non-lysosomal ceramidase N-terminal domain-containing protein [Kiritimatiellia bacterium]